MDSKGRTAETHVFTRETEIRAESLILGESLTGGQRVLDVGCAATGRSARLAQTFGPSVCSIDVNLDSLRRFRARPDGQDIEAVHATVEELPFSDGAFDMVLIALHGLDYLDAPQRAGALLESYRVLRPGGRLVFNTNNPIGAILSPRALTHRPYLAWRLRQAAQLGFLRPFLTDSNGLTLYQATPRAVIGQVEQVTRLRFEYALNRAGGSRNLLLLTLLSAGPYYVFRRAVA